MQIHVEVTQEDMDLAEFEYCLNDGPSWTECCPISQALRRQLPGYDWKVDPMSTPTNVWIGSERAKAVPLDVYARRFGRAWDRSYRHRDNWPLPVSFDIDLPIEVSA